MSSTFEKIKRLQAINKAIMMGSNMIDEKNNVNSIEKEKNNDKKLSNILTNLTMKQVVNIQKSDISKHRPINDSRQRILNRWNKDKSKDKDKANKDRSAYYGVSDLEDENYNPLDSKERVRRRLARNQEAKKAKGYQQYL